MIMRTGAHGDILMGTTILPALRRAYPTCHLTWLAEHSEYSAIEANPYIDEIVRWDGSWFKHPLRRWAFATWGLRLLTTYRSFRARKYDVFVSFQPEEWPLLLKAVGADVTVGIFDTFRRYYGNPPTSSNVRLYNHAYTHPNLPNHRIDQYLLTLDGLAVPRPDQKRMTMGFTRADRDAARAYLSERGIPPPDGGSDRRGYLVVAPMTTWPTKSWSHDRYVQLCNTIQTRTGLPIVLIGSGKEREQIEALAARLDKPAVIAAGTLTFREAAALISDANAMVSGDTGPMHVAGAVGTPHVAIFGATSPHWYGPVTPLGTAISKPVPCGPCDQKICPNPPETRLACLDLVTVDEVLAALEACLRIRCPA